MKPPDCTSRALRAFLEAPPGEQARAAFGAFTQTAAAEEKRDAADPRAAPLPGLDTAKPEGEPALPGLARAGKRRVSRKQRALRIRYLARRKSA